MEISENDTRLLQDMKRYFEAKAEADLLKLRLEEARRSADSSIADFYDPRVNWAWAQEIARRYALKAEMSHLMASAEAWASGRLFDTRPPSHSGGR